jgi:hypothetical protein
MSMRVAGLPQALLFLIPYAASGSMFLRSCLLMLTTYLLSLPTFCTRAVPPQ